jgi:rhodanese-related sulfurtransferase
MSDCRLIGVAKAQEMYSTGQEIFIDVREQDEFARENVAGANNIPLSELSLEAVNKIATGTSVVFYCRSGNRTAQAINKLVNIGLPNVYILEGGLIAWKDAGGEIVVNKKAPLPIMQQVQIVVGVMVLLGIVLSYFVSPYFILLSAFFGAGLIFSGVTGFCGLAKILMLLPKNKKESR